MVLVVTGLMLVSLVVALAAVVDLSSGGRQQQRVVRSVIDSGSEARRDGFAEVDRTFRRTRLGRRLERELVVAGVDRSPLAVLVAAVATALTVSITLWVALAPAIGVVGLLSGVLGVRWYLGRGRERRREAFIAQMPELARVLANATHAGLSIPTAIAVAADELDDPARTELRRVSASLTFGEDLDTALSGIRDRLPSREVAILVSTLLVSARSGGSLVTSLRTIAETLEARKDTRREIRTTLAQSVATGYLVIAMGFGLLFVLNAIQPGTARLMTERPVGQIALIVAASLFAGGFLLIRRMTRIEP